MQLFDRLEKRFDLFDPYSSKGKKAIAANPLRVAHGVDSEAREALSHKGGNPRVSEVNRIDIRQRGKRAVIVIIRSNGSLAKNAEGVEDEAARL